MERKCHRSRECIAAYQLGLVTAQLRVVISAFPETAFAELHRRPKSQKKSKVNGWLIPAVQVPERVRPVALLRESFGGMCEAAKRGMAKGDGTLIRLIYKET